MTLEEVLENLSSSELQIPVFETQRLRGIHRPIHLEGRGFRPVENLEFRDLELNGTGGKLEVFLSLKPGRHLSLDGQDPLVAKNACLGVTLFIYVGIETI